MAGITEGELDAVCDNRACCRSAMPSASFRQYHRASPRNVTVLERNYLQHSRAPSCKLTAGANVRKFQVNTEMFREIIRLVPVPAASPHGREQPLAHQHKLPRCTASTAGAKQLPAGCCKGTMTRHSQVVLQVNTVAWLLGIQKSQEKDLCRQCRQHVSGHAATASIYHRTSGQGDRFPEA